MVYYKIKSKEGRTSIMNKTNEKLNLITKNTNDEILLTDENFNILSRNNKILGGAMAGVNNFLEILTLNSQDYAIETLKDFAQGKEPETMFRVILSRDSVNEELRNCDARFTKTTVSRFSSENAQEQYLVIMNDYTERIEKETVRESYKETISHDMRTPLIAQARVLEMLYDEKMGPMNDSQKEMLRETISSTKYVIHMIDNVRRNLLAESEGLTFHKYPYSVKQTTERSLKELKYMLESMNQKVKISSDVEADICLYDEKFILVVLENVLTNASQHSPKGATIYITIKQHAKNITVAIRNEGESIGHKADEIFRKHRSVDQKFKRIGAGVGLVLSQKIMEGHNGSISLNKELTDGTEFIISLPYDAKVANSVSSAESVQ